MAFEVGVKALTSSHRKAAAAIMFMEKPCRTYGHGFLVSVQPTGARRAQNCRRVFSFIQTPIAKARMLLAIEPLPPGHAEEIDS